MGRDIPGIPGTARIGNNSTTPLTEQHRYNSNGSLAGGRQPDEPPQLPAPPHVERVTFQGKLKSYLGALNRLNGDTARKGHHRRTSTFQRVFGTHVLVSPLGEGVQFPPTKPLLRRGSSALRRILPRGDGSSSSLSCESPMWQDPAESDADGAANIESNAQAEHITGLMEIDFCLSSSSDDSSDTASVYESLDDFPDSDSEEYNELEEVTRIADIATAENRIEDTKLCVSPAYAVWNDEIQGPLPSDEEQHQQHGHSVLGAMFNGLHALGLQLKNPWEKQKRTEREHVDEDNKEKKSNVTFELSAEQEAAQSRLSLRRASILLASPTHDRTSSDGSVAGLQSRIRVRRDSLELASMASRSPEDRKHRRSLSPIIVLCHSLGTAKLNQPQPPPPPASNEEYESAGDDLAVNHADADNVVPSVFPGEIDVASADDAVTIMNGVVADVDAVDIGVASDDAVVATDTALNDDEDDNASVTSSQATTESMSDDWDDPMLDDGFDLLSTSSPLHIIKVDSLVRLTIHEETDDEAESDDENADSGDEEEAEDVLVRRQQSTDPQFLDDIARVFGEESGTYDEKKDAETESDMESNSSFSSDNGQTATETTPVPAPIEWSPPTDIEQILQHEPDNEDDNQNNREEIDRSQPNQDEISQSDDSAGKVVVVLASKKKILKRSGGVMLDDVIDTSQEHVSGSFVKKPVLSWDQWWVWYNTLKERVHALKVAATLDIDQGTSPTAIARAKTMEVAYAIESDAFHDIDVPVSVCWITTVNSLLLEEDENRPIVYWWQEDYEPKPSDLLMTGELFADSNSSNSSVSTSARSSGGTDDLLGTSARGSDTSSVSAGRAVRFASGPRGITFSAAPPRRPHSLSCGSSCSSTGSSESEYHGMSSQINEWEDEDGDEYERLYGGTGGIGEEEAEESDEEEYSRLYGDEDYADEGCESEEEEEEEEEVEVNVKVERRGSGLVFDESRARRRANSPHVNPKYGTETYGDDGWL